MSDHLENLIYNLIDRYMNGGVGAIGNTRFHERHGMVTAYDPDKHLAKVMLWPSGQETGWLPIETAHVGNDYGIAIGLQPGDGKTTGDQVIVRHQEGDLESGKIVQRVHSDDEQPPRVESGEMVLWAKFKQSEGKSTLGDDTTDGGGGGDNDEGQSGQGGSGGQIYFKKDGSITLTDGNGASIILDGNGNIKFIAKNIQGDASNDITMIAQTDVGIKGGNNVEVQAGSIAGIDAASFVAVQGGGSVSDLSVSQPGAPPAIPPFSVPS